METFSHQGVHHAVQDALLGQWDSKALTSLVGLAPWSRDSGCKRGHRAIRGGRGVVRKALYLCACSVGLADWR